MWSTIDGDSAPSIRKYLKAQCVPSAGAPVGSHRNLTTNVACREPNVVRVGGTLGSAGGGNAARRGPITRVAPVVACGVIPQGKRFITLPKEKLDKLRLPLAGIDRRGHSYIDNKSTAQIEFILRIRAARVVAIAVV